MARSKDQNEAIARKVNRLIREGYPVNQAQAIAFRMFRDGEIRVFRRPQRKRRNNLSLKKVDQALKLLGLAKAAKGK
tara:strand:+ start:1045 stop:1275 length:231 start_codon:yes stop_codon:yes gene_type:complete